MSAEKNFFDEQIKSIRILSAIYAYLTSNAVALDSTSLLRAEYVLIISAFDSYLHNIVRRKLSEGFFEGDINNCTVNLSLESFYMIHTAATLEEKRQLLDLEIRKILEKDSYQSPKSVEYAMKTIGVTSIWRKTEETFGDTGEHIKNRLALIVKRRNQIAHESDIDFISDTLRPIDYQTVEDCRDFITKLVLAIDLQIC